MSGGTTMEQKAHKPASSASLLASFADLSSIRIFCSRFRRTYRRSQYNTMKNGHSQENNYMFWCSIIVIAASLIPWTDSFSVASRIRSAHLYCQTGGVKNFGTVVAYPNSCNIFKTILEKRKASSLMSFHLALDSSGDEGDKYDEDEDEEGIDLSDQDWCVEKEWCVFFAWFVS